MIPPLCACHRCGQTFWSMGASEPYGNFCPACRPVYPEPVPVRPREPEQAVHRFVSLSSLPPDKRLPGRNEALRTGLKVPRRLQETASEAPPPAAAEEQPPLPPQALQPVVEVVPRELHKMGFNCPSCYTVLIIKDPGAYDGRPAPCPYCAVRIIPPRIAPDSPFTLLATPSEALSELPQARQNHWRPFGKNRAVVSAEMLTA
jgi:hypothetical protein